MFVKKLLLVVALLSLYLHYKNAVLEYDMIPLPKHLSCAVI